MKKVFMSMALLLIFISTTNSQDAQRYVLNKADGTTQYGYYEIDNDGNFIREKEGVLTFFFSNPDYKAEFIDNEILCNTAIIKWKPKKSDRSKTISILIRRKSDQTVVDPNVPMQLPIKPNSAPRCIHSSELAFSKISNQALTINLDEYVIDDDNDPLRITWVSNPNGFPNFINTTLTLPANRVSTSTSEVGVASIYDGSESKSLILTIHYQVPPTKPKFLPEPDSEGRINHEPVVSEGDLVYFAIKAYDVTTNREVANTQISGGSLGLRYSDGVLGGTIGYDVLQSNLSKEEANAIYTKTIKLISINAQGPSEVSVVFKIKAKGSEADYLAYNANRVAVTSQANLYNEEIIKKWNIIYTDLRRAQRSADVISAIDTGLKASGGVAILTVNVPAATILQGLQIINSSISGLLTKREIRIQTNLKTLINAVNLIQDPVTKFMTNYKPQPEDQYLLTTKGLNTMEDDKNSVITKNLEFQGIIASITQVTSSR